MKTIKFFFLFVGILQANLLIAQNHFIGIYRIQNKGCGDYVMEQKQVTDGVEFDQASKEFKANHKGENPTTYFVKATDFAIAYEFMTHLFPGACKYKEISLIKGSSLEKIRGIIQDSYTKYKGTYVTAPQEIAVFSAVEKNDANGQVVSKEYTNIAVKIISHKAQGKSAFTAQLSNKHPTKAMVVKFKTQKEGIPTLVDGKGNNTEEVILMIPPGATTTQKLGNAEFYEMYISEPQDYNIEAKEEDYIQSIKTWIGEQIKTKEKKIESFSGSPVIRG